MHKNTIIEKKNVIRKKRDLTCAAHHKEKAQFMVCHTSDGNYNTLNTIGSNRFINIRHI